MKLMYFAVLCCLMAIQLGGCDANFADSSKGRGGNQQKFKDSSQEKSPNKNSRPNGNDPNQKYGDPDLREGSDQEDGKFQGGEDLGSDDGEIEFSSKGKVFHIGDGKVGDQCKVEVEEKSLSGISYNFAFKATEANTTVEVIIRKICGVEGKDSNKLQLLKGSEEFESKNIAADGELSLGQVKLSAKGSYSVKVESQEIKDGEHKGQRDDFLVGRVIIRSDKPLEKGKVTAK